MPRFSVGIDFGTLSARAVLVDVCSGEAAARSEFVYPHAVFDGGAGGAFQDPRDYIEALIKTVGELLSAPGIKKEDIIGVGVDFTSCTVIPVDGRLEPLCFREEFSGEPYANAVLWKHRADGTYTGRVNSAAAEYEPQRLERYGGKITAESYLPKILEIKDRAPAVFSAAASFIEAGDYIVSLLTGKDSRSVCQSGFKAFYDTASSFPRKEFYRAVFGDDAENARKKTTCRVLSPGVPAGGVCERFSLLTGLREGTPVAAALIDAHAFIPGAGVLGEGEFVAVCGTSTCLMTVSDSLYSPKGISGAVADAVYPGMYAYEAGQSAVGDMFAAFAGRFVTNEDQTENIHDKLSREAGSLSPGSGGLIALDWVSGNRSPLADSALSGLILGLTLDTKPCEVYRALIESTAYGLRRITEEFEKSGMKPSKLILAGGIPAKNKLFCEIYADALGLPVSVPSFTDCGALGSAMAGAAAAGRKNGGCDSLREAAGKMSPAPAAEYLPDLGRRAVYDRLYAEYSKLFNYFALGSNDVMKRLRELK